MTIIRTIQELEEPLSRPTAADVSAMAALKGDLLILGAGGKMGPSLAAVARRAANQTQVRQRIIAVSRFGDESLRCQLSSHNIETISCDLLEPGVLAKFSDAENLFRSQGPSPQTQVTWQAPMSDRFHVPERFGLLKLLKDKQ